MKKFFATLLLTFVGLAHANLYECKDANSSPEPVKSGAQKKLSFSTTKPFRLEYGFDEDVHQKNLKPFVLYYAIDSAEPFMQYTVRYELAQLRKSCEKSANVNFVAILNSLYTKKNEIVLCKDKVFRKVNLKKYPSLDKSLKEKRNFFLDKARPVRYPHGFDYDYPLELSQAYYNNPLVLENFLYELTFFVITNEDFFPHDKYLPYMTLKSHGSKERVLSGLHDCQLQAKTLSQNEVIQKNLTKAEIALLKKDDYSGELKKVNVALNKIGLGSAVGVGGDSNLGEMNLGEMNLGEMNLGEMNLGETVQGLGAGEGLGSSFRFGTHHLSLMMIMTKLFDDMDDTDEDPETISKYLGFMMLESCDTNRDFTFYDTMQINTLASYSAQHSLWYRNLNLWSILEDANGSSRRMSELMLMYTAKIPNISVK